MGTDEAGSEAAAGAFNEVARFRSAEEPSRLPLRYRALTIVTKKGQVFSEHSTSLELPKKLTQILVKGDEVSDNLDALMEQLDGIESHRIVMQFLKKRRFIYECVTAVLMRFLLDLVAY